MAHEISSSKYLEDQVTLSTTTLLGKMGQIAEMEGMGLPIFPILHISPVFRIATLGAQCARIPPWKTGSR